MATDRLEHVVRDAHLCELGDDRVPQIVEPQAGPPKAHTIQRDGDRDLALNAWIIGQGEVRVPPDASKIARGTTVEIFLTDNGRLLASRAAWTRRPGSAESVSRYTSMPPKRYPIACGLFHGKRKDFAREMAPSRKLRASRL